MTNVSIPQAQMLEIQIRSIRLTAPHALDYHFTNYCNAHSGINLSWKQGEKINVKDHIQRLHIIRFELIAYLNWLGRIYHFVKNMRKKGWPNLIFTDDFMVFRRKWASHRSMDYPEDEDDFLHLQILLNLDTSQTFNAKGEYEPCLSLDGKEISFNLFKRHHEIQNELKKIFLDLATPPSQKK